MNYIDFKYYLRYFAGGVWHYYYVDNAGTVQDTTTKTELTYTPKNWDDIVLTWERGFTYHGIFQAFTVPIEFVKDGAKILRHLYVYYGTEGACQLYIEKFNRTIAVYDYEPYYYGDVDFSRFNDKKDFVNVEIMEGGFMAKLKAKESTDIEIDVIDSVDRVWVNMEGVEVSAVFIFTGIAQPVDNSPPTFVQSRRENFPTILYSETQGYSNGDHNPKGNDFIGIYSQMFNQTYAGVADMITLASADKWIIHNTSDTFTYDYHLLGSMTIDHANSVVSSRVCDMYVFVNGAAALGTSVVKTNIATGGTIPGLGTLSEVIVIDTVVTLAPNEQCWLWFRHSGVPGQVSYHVNKLDLNISVVNAVKQAYVSARRTFDVFTELVADIDSTATATSTLLSSTEVTKVVTSGDALRGLEKSQLKTNFNKFYTSVNALFNTCLTYNKATNTVYINDKVDAYDEATQILDLGTINNLVTIPFSSEMFAKLIIGYPNVSIDSVNGKDEFNLEQTYQSELVRITTEKKIVSDYHAGMYEITLQVANLVGKINADNESDNDVFWLHIESTPAGTIPAGLPGAGEDYYLLERSGYTITSGLLSPSTAFNLFLSPKLMMFKHGNYINSVLYPQYDLNNSLIFKSSSKTQNDEDYLIWDIGGPTIFEKSTENLQDLDSMIFYPIIFEFDSMIPANILTILNSNPYGKVKFTYNDLDYYGFIISMSDKPTLSSKQTYRLLCSISTDLNNIIV